MCILWSLRKKFRIGISQSTSDQRSFYVGSVDQGKILLRSFLEIRFQQFFCSGVVANREDDDEDESNKKKKKRKKNKINSENKDLEDTNEKYKY